jgi:hypothetical protein
VIDRMNVSWREFLDEEMQRNGDTWNEVEQMTLTVEGLNRKFDATYGSSQGEPFTVWTKNWVYFPAVYDGSEWADSVARNPNGHPKRHVGGE